MNNEVHWQRLDRKTVYDSKFLKVYEDKVRLSNGKVIDDYTVVEKPSIVMIVATDTENNVIVLREYKYAADEMMLVLPAGHKKSDEEPVDAARRELLEETGFGGGTFEEVGILRDYPTKDLHKVYVVRADGVSRQADTQHEDTENITFQLVTLDELKQQIINKEWKSSSALASVTLSGVLF
jgi:8-oxo-dGTP pyrophosphatase MutT (NUDIX family)